MKSIHKTHSSPIRLIIDNTTSFCVHNGAVGDQDVVI